MNIVYFTKFWPRRNCSAQLETSISLIQSLINLNHQIIICSDEQNFEVKQKLKQYPFEMLDINPKRISYSLNGLSQSGFKPNMFFFDSVETEEKYSAFIYNRWNKSPRVLNINNLNGLSKWRKNNYKIIPHVLIPHGSPMNPSKAQQIFTLSQIRSIIRSDYVISSNQYIYHLIGKYMFENAKNKSKHISQVNIGFPLDEYYGEIVNLRYRPFVNRQNYIFFGNMDNQSNRDCVYILAKYIWPIIKKQLPEAQLHIYGEGGAFYQKIFKKSSEEKELSKQNLKKMKILFKGVMKDLQKLSQYKALLYPSTYSAGSHLKILQSWFQHLPVVTTPIGAEGLFYQSIDPQFSSPADTRISSGFSSERVYTKQQIQASKRASQYYQNNIITGKNLNLTFGGFCKSITYSQFAQNAIKIYKDEVIWNQSLKNGQNIIKRNQNDMYLQNVLKRVMVRIQMAAYEGKSRESYIQQWKRYSKSQQFSKKIKS